MAKHIRLSIPVFIIIFTQHIFAQNFTWMRGSTAAAPGGIYGIPGTTNVVNNPGGRENAINWKDAAGNIWVFGGKGRDANASGGYLNDLWKYNPVTNVWIWVSGPSVINQLGTYGTLGVPGASTTPGSRMGSVSWMDQSGNLWLFGGYGLGSQPGLGNLNDVWRYNTSTNQWTWIGGSNLIYQPGTYGMQGVASPTNIPSSRIGAKCWTDNTSQMWLFGGFGCTTNTLFVGVLNDLWKFDLTTNQWTWVKGSNNVNTNGSYGTQALGSPTNTPGGRQWPMGWTDIANGKLWLFGGDGMDGANIPQGLLNDLWQYDLILNEWTWISGSNTINQTGNYATFGTPSPANRPGARNNGITWLDGIGNYWLFGGSGITTNTVSGHLNDLWKYNLNTSQWTWVRGNNSNNQNGAYGSQGVSSSTNVPGARYGSVNWMDNNNNLWFFGGNGYPATGASGELADVWKFQNCFISPITLTITTAFENICAGEATSLTVVGATTYTWNNNSNQSFIVIAPKVTTVYSVSTTGINDCVYTNSYTQTVLPCTSIITNLLNNEIGVYPNPNSGVISIRGITDKNTQLIIFDNLGRNVFEKKLFGNTEQIKTGLTPGIYFYKISESEKIYSGKLIVE